MILFGPGIVFFTVHYLMLRGFYALELNRTVFFIQCVVAATNVVVALALVSGATPRQTSPALVVAYAASYVLGSALSYLILRARLGGLETGGAAQVPAPAADRGRGLHRRRPGPSASCYPGAATTCPTSWPASGSWSWGRSTSGSSSSWPAPCAYVR